MNRRDLLKILLASPATAFIDFEKLLWVPRPIITVPEAPLVITVSCDVSEFVRAILYANTELYKLMGIPVKFMSE